jgi:hypothetical protein
MPGMKSVINDKAFSDFEPTASGMSIRDSNIILIPTIRIKETNLNNTKHTLCDFCSKFTAAIIFM